MSFCYSADSIDKSHIYLEKRRVGCDCTAERNLSFDETRSLFAQITAKGSVYQAAAETCRVLTAYGGHEKLVSNIAIIFNMSHMFNDCNAYIRDIYERGMSPDERFKDAAMETVLDLRKCGYAEVASELVSVSNITEPALADKKAQVEKRSIKERLDILHCFEAMRRGEPVNPSDYGEWLNIWAKIFSKAAADQRASEAEELRVARRQVADTIRLCLRKLKDDEGPPPTQ